MRSASKACSALMSKYLLDLVSDVLDNEKKIAHKALASKVDAKLDDAKWFKQTAKMSADFDSGQLDWVYGPVVQSGGKYDFKLGANADAEIMHSGVIVAGLGLRYKTYCSLIARTYLVDPNKSQENNYKFLVSILDAVLKDIREGTVVKDLYNKAIGMIKSKKPDLEKHFVKHIGAGIGIETRDNALILNGKNTRTLKDGMTLFISVGFNDLKNSQSQDKKAENYSLLITETVRVNRNDAAVFTKDAPIDLDSIEFFFQDDKPAPKKDEKPARTAIAQNNITKTKLRAERTTQVDEGADARRREHQKDLQEKLQKRGLEQYTESTGDQNGVAKKKFKRFESYKRSDQLPSRAKDLSVFVDTKNSTLILPIMGRPVPFHINTVKNASTTHEGEFVYLRINLLSPGQGVGRKDDQPFEDASAHFVRSLTFRSKDADRMEDIAQSITELRKNAVRKEQEKKQLEDVVEQDKLIEIRNRRPQRLGELYLRPAMDGKRVPGEVEIHQNGLRYVNPMRSEHVDVLFSNVKHLFFQPSVGELIVIIHVHLKNPIMIGKKKTKDVQFYREATDMAFDETGTRKRKHRYGDEDEYEQEQQEQRRREALDREFSGFAKKIQDAATDESIGVDVPHRDLGFTGVPFRSSVLMQPSADCLVQLTEPPFTVITLNEIEVAHLERVQVSCCP